MVNSAANKSPKVLLNGRSVSIGHNVHATLLDFLRDQGLTGAKEGCAEGECGACTVVMLEDHGGGCAYRAVNSCLMLAPMAADREIYTVEALAARGELAEVQKAMAAAGGSQCGYCTPGFVMSMFAEQYRPGRVGACDPQRLGGNLCRCTGYRPIRDAALSLGPAPEGALRERLSLPAPRLEPVAYSAEDAVFERPGSLDECFAIAAAHPEARWISGATDMGVESNLRFRRWPRLVSLEGVAELREFLPEQRRGADRRGAFVDRGRIALGGCAGSVPRMAGIVRVTTDSESRDAGRESRDGVPDRRCGSVAPGVECVRAGGRMRGEGAPSHWHRFSRRTGRLRSRPASC